MTISTRFVPFALGAALIAMAAGTAAAEPPDPRESPRAHAVARVPSAPSPGPASVPAPTFHNDVPRASAADNGVDRPTPRGFDPAPRPVRFSENGEADGGQARQRVPPSSGGSRAGSGSSPRPSGGSSGSSAGSGTARPRGGHVDSSPRSGSSDDGGRRGDPGQASEGSRRYPGPGSGYAGSGRQGGPDVRGGYAVRRGSVPYSYYPRYDYRRSYRPSYYYPYYGNLGLGYYFWDPSWYGWGYDDYGGYGGYGYGPYSTPDAYGYGARYDDTGSVRVRVTPRDAQVYVDGYYVGVVDEFDGTFQRLKLEEGPHRIEIRLDGFDTLRFDVRVLLDSNMTLRGDLRPLP